jgi:hypothetical protein
MLFAVVLCFGTIGLASPIGTAFTYQGRLIDANNAADGEYDFQFKLFDANSDGNQLGADVNKPEVDVIDGYFTVELDFGIDSNLFNGDERWLDIGVRPGDLDDPNVYTTLSPRQAITPTPYAIYAGGGVGADSDWIISGNDMYSGVSGNVGIGTTNPTDKLDVVGNINSSESYKLDGNTVLANTGSRNIFVGEDAGVINIGSDNSAVGYRALYSNTEGYANSAVGVEALHLNTEGYFNSAIGAAALNSNTTGHNNSAVGFLALVENTTGIYNSAIGTESLKSNTTGNDNSAIGVKALYSNTEGKYNSAIGSDALRSNTTGNYNTAVGARAGTQCTGNGNIFLGYRAGYDETGDNKLYIANSSDGPPLIYGDFSAGYVGIGTTSPDAELEVAGRVKITGGSPAEGKVLTSDAAGLATWQTPAAGTGDNLGNHTATQNILLNGHWLSGDGGSEGVYVANDGNVGIGTTSPAAKLSVNGDISAASNYKIGGSTVLSTPSGSATLVGIGAGQVTAGGVNTFIGYHAGYSNTGSYNTFTGTWAGENNTEGSYNTFSGVEAGYSNEGYYNTFSGWRAGWRNTTGGGNTFTGVYAGCRNTTGCGNTFLGFEAGYDNNDGNNNTFIGTSAGINNITGNYNTFIGTSTGLNNITGNYNTFIGTSTGLNNITGNYNTFLGEAAGYNNETGYRNVFLGNQAGYNELGSNKLYIANGSADANVLIYGDFSTGRIGLGTTSPTQRLHVVGSAQFDKTGPEVGRLILNTVNRNDPGRYGIVFANNLLAPFLGDDTQDQFFGFLTGWSDTRTYSAHLNVYGKATGNWGCYIGMSHDGNDGIINTDVGDIVLVPALNVGIGLSSPTEKLDIFGTARLRGIGSSIGTTVVVDGNGKLWKQSSSRRYKKNIETLDTGQDAILKLRPVRFEYKETGQKDIGLIAEEVEKISPDLVIYDNEGRPDAVKYDKVALYLLSVIKNQQKENEDIKNRLASIESLMSRLSLQEEGGVK